MTSSDFQPSFPGKTESGTCFLMSGLATKSDAYYDGQRYMVCGILEPKTVTDTFGWYQSGRFIWAQNCDFDNQNALIRTMKTEILDCGYQCLHGSNKLCTHLVYSSTGECKLMKGLAGKGNAEKSGNGICAIVE